MRATVLGVVVLLAGLVARAEPQVYAESLMVKVRPDTAPHAGSAVQLMAARNEAVSFQVIVHGGDTGASAVTARCAGLDGPTHLGGRQLTLYREGYLEVTAPSGGPGGVGSWPDALVPDVDEVSGEPRRAFPFDVPRGEARGIWVDLLVPEDAPPGSYQGTVEVRDAERALGSVSVALTVVDVVLPSTPQYATAFGMEPDLVCEAHTGRKDCGSDDARANLVGLYARLALDHRLTLSDVFVIQPAGGWWDRFDAVYGPLLDGTAATRLKGARMTSAQYMGPLEDSALAAFVEHFTARGWIDRAYDYTADEPPLFSTYDALRARAAVLQRSAPGLVRMVTTSLPKAQANGVEDLIGRISVLIQLMSSNAPADAGVERPAYDTFLTRPGTSLWLYQSCSSHGCVGGMPADKHWPSYMVDHPAALNRAMPWVVFLQHASGESYYETTARLVNAWTDQSFYGGNGDGTLFYPGTPERIGGTTHVPLPSLRLKLLRAGVQDYEWLMRVAEAGDPDFAAQVARELVPAADQITLDGDAFERARERLIARSLELGPGGPRQESIWSTDRGFSETTGCGCGETSPGTALTACGAGLVWALLRRRRRLQRSLQSELSKRARGAPRRP
ncbi:hypothetical protein DRW03_29385 [Corallococcus sp. H22C18031201]|uniref:DUF4091 domain-containing protein n=1 Tax=Citreicoccus inhibens TaxID=2849499 RepID=UPI000E75D928|nr:DUF4091 domain-containing protein [Citreicoccus inhibens]MBU8897434.1 DUF4091 domain-containing protein [Citreicoccus inhibens]RJS16788.1 hypothetical protein DRW03_29385 [Corallococcus sp. H22C18031201]